MTALPVLLSLIPVSADATPIPATASVMPWLVIGLLVICIGAVVWGAVSRKKKK